MFTFFLLKKATYSNKGYSIDGHLGTYLKKLQNPEFLNINNVFVLYFLALNTWLA